MIRFTIDPDPPVPGKSLKICYDFAGLQITEAGIKIDWRPESIPDGEETVTESNPCVTVKVPANATGGFLIDQTGNSGDLGFFVA